MNLKNTTKTYLKIEVIALTCILIGEICYYKIGYLPIYWALTGIGMMISLFHVGFGFYSRVVRLNSFAIWIFFVFAMYFLYGFLFLQKGDFPWDTLSYRLVECVAIYILTKKLLLMGNNSLAYPFVYAGIFSFIYLFISEGQTILLGTARIGNSMSGNVNTVGYNFGIISLFVMWWYCNEKKSYKLLIFSAFAAMMLLTGSKKTLIILAIDFGMLFSLERKNASRWIKLGFVISFLLYLIFNVPALYEIIGSRVESMFETMIYGQSAKIYSHSTDVRDEMIKEGFQLFLTKPIFGGGWNYFWSRTIYGYEYSHNNYIELLCSFGIVGALLYYSKQVGNAVSLVLNRRILGLVDKNLLALAISFCLVTFLIDWAAVTFSVQCVFYLPVICASAILENLFDRLQYNAGDMTNE